MVEVFKTNIKEWEQANMLIEKIHKIFTDYKANFDLEDCDNILRVKNTKGTIQSSSLVDLLRRYGYHAEILHDIPMPARLLRLPNTKEFTNNDF